MTTTTTTDHAAEVERLRQTALLWAHPDGTRTARVGWLQRAGHGATQDLALVALARKIVRHRRMVAARRSPRN